MFKMSNHLNLSGLIFNHLANKINCRIFTFQPYLLNKQGELLKTGKQNQKAL